MGLSGFLKRDRNDTTNKDGIRQMRQRFFLQRGPLEEPSFLGFKVMFDFVGAYYSPLLKLATPQTEQAEQKQVVGGLGGSNGFNIPSPQNTETAQASSLSDSAEEYLMFNGYSDKASNLRSFVNQLSALSMDAEWYFKGITGLDSAWNFDFTDTKVRGENGEGVIQINLEESLDMRATGMLLNYYTASRDTQNRRDILPENLKYFAMKVYIADFRDFVAFDKRLFTANYAAPGGGFNTGEAFQRALGKTDVNTIDIPIVEITFNNCYFDFASMASMFADISNEEPTQAAQTLDIRYCGEVEYSMINLADNSVIDSKSDATVVNGVVKKTAGKLGDLASKVGVPDTLADSISSEFANFGTRLAGQGLGIVNQNIERLRGELRSLVLGNVYNSNITTSLRETLLNGAARSIVPGIEPNPFNGEI